MSDSLSLFCVAFMLLTFRYGPVTSPPEGNLLPDMGLPRTFFNFPWSAAAPDKPISCYSLGLVS
jgi:hypothetical protein